MIRGSGGDTGRDKWDMTPTRSLTNVWHGTQLGLEDTDPSALAVEFLQKFNRVF